MSDEIYRIDITQNIEAQLNKALVAIATKKTVKRIQDKVGKDVDKEISRVFRYMAVMLLAQRLNASAAPKEIKPYVPIPWESYNIPANPYVQKYRKRKKRLLGHTQSFVYKQELVEDFQSINTNQVLDAAGRTRISVTKNKKFVTLNLLPDTNFSRTRYEDNFTEVFNDEKTWRKLKNRRNRYRSLVGPYFAYFLDQKLPDIIRKSLRSL